MNRMAIICLWAKLYISVEKDAFCLSKLAPQPRPRSPFEVCSRKLLLRRSAHLHVNYVPCANCWICQGHAERNVSASPLPTGEYMGLHGVSKYTCTHTHRLAWFPFQDCLFSCHSSGANKPARCEV